MIGNRSNRLNTESKIGNLNFKRTSGIVCESLRRCGTALCLVLLYIRNSRLQSTLSFCAVTDVRDIRGNRVERARNEGVILGA